MQGLPPNLFEMVINVTEVCPHLQFVLIQVIIHQCPLYRIFFRNTRTVAVFRQFNKKRKHLTTLPFYLAHGVQCIPHGGTKQCRDNVTPLISRQQALQRITHLLPFLIKSWFRQAYLPAALYG